MKKGFIFLIGIFLGFIIFGFIYILISNSHKIPISIIRDDSIPVFKATSTHAQQTPLPSDQVININTANIDDLDALPGIGIAKANAIIEYREKFGDFTSIDDLLLVPGIGPSILDQIRGMITVNDMIP